MFKQGSGLIYIDIFVQKKASQNASKLASEKLEFVKEHEYTLLLECEVCYVNWQVQSLVDQ